MDQPSLDLLLAADGDDRAFERVVRATESDVRRFCTWQGASGADLDDVIQETYVRAYRGLNSYRASSSGVAWLLSIARRACLDQADTRRRDRRNLDAVRDLTPSDVVTSVSHDLEILDLVKRLPNDFREAFVIVRLLGYSYDEAASIIGCPRGTVQSRVSRARLGLVAMVNQISDEKVS